MDSLGLMMNLSGGLSGYKIVYSDSYNAASSGNRTIYISVSWDIGLIASATGPNSILMQPVLFAPNMTNGISAVFVNTSTTNNSYTYINGNIFTSVTSSSIELKNTYGVAFILFVRE